MWVDRPALIHRAFTSLHASSMRTTQVCCVARHAERADSAFALYRRSSIRICRVLVCTAGNDSDRTLNHHRITENWGTTCFETSNWRCDFQTVLWRMSQPQSRSGTRFLGQGCSLCSVRGLCTVSLRSTSQHLGCFLLGKRAMNRSSRIALLSLFGIPHISHGFTMFYSDLYSLSMPFHGILKLLRKKCQLLFRKRFPSLAGRTEVMMVSAERLS